MKITKKHIDSFWNKVKKTESCWLWTAAKTRGYGSFFPCMGTHIYAHRFSYELIKGKIPKGLTIDHLCRVINCVNPAHLEAVTLRENVLRGNSLSARRSRQTHCIRGHKLDSENVYTTKRRQRHCKKCINIRARIYRQRKREEKCHNNAPDRRNEV